MKRIKRIDLTNKKIFEARKIMKRLISYRNLKNFQISFYFLLPPYKSRRKSYFFPDKISSNCPYCGSALVDTIAGLVCSGKRLLSIGEDIHKLIAKWGVDKAELFLSKKSNRFYDEYLYSLSTGEAMTCNYVVGTEEGRWKIKPRILMKGVDRRKVFAGK